MKVCPIAVVAGCSKCPVVSICPLKGVIGDFEAPAEKKPAAQKPTKKSQ